MSASIIALISSDSFMSNSFFFHKLSIYSVNTFFCQIITRQNALVTSEELYFGWVFFFQVGIHRMIRSN